MNLGLAQKITIIFYRLQRPTPLQEISEQVNNGVNSVVVCFSCGCFSFLPNVRAGILCGFVSIFIKSIFPPIIMPDTRTVFCYSVIAIENISQFFSYIAKIEQNALAVKAEVVLHQNSRLHS
uniref:Uncharacterized protein n=1 Tax=Glossina pallidipes TaxID=7398 RepID=A0A1B0AFA1_GLOPL